jgi:hypothetical protein
VAIVVDRYAQNRAGKIMTETSNIADVSAWTKKTLQVIERDCFEAGAPCVGFALIFHDPIAGEDEQWRFKIRLGFDPHHPPSKEERKEIEDALEHIAQGVAEIMGGKKSDDISEFSAKGTFH